MNGTEQKAETVGLGKQVLMEHSQKVAEMDMVGYSRNQIGTIDIETDVGNGHAGRLARKEVPPESCLGPIGMARGLGIAMMATIKTITTYTVHGLSTRIIERIVCGTTIAESWELALSCTAATAEAQEIVTEEIQHGKRARSEYTPKSFPVTATGTRIVCTTCTNVQLGAQKAGGDRPGNALRALQTNTHLPPTGLLARTNHTAAWERKCLLTLKKRSGRVQLAPMAHMKPQQSTGIRFAAVLRHIAN